MHQRLKDCITAIVIVAGFLLAIEAVWTVADSGSNASSPEPSSRQSDTVWKLLSRGH